VSETTTQKTTLIGGALAAFASTVCCLGPLVLVTLGVSGAWISNLTALMPYRYAFIGAALVFMALAWRSIYRRPAAETCAPGGACAVPRTNRVYKTMFWLVSGLVLLALAYPYLLPLFY
jgi:mercuric ion transport protein